MSLCGLARFTIIGIFIWIAKRESFGGSTSSTLAVLPGGDLVGRDLTSRAHGRPVAPPCYHGDPYPGFYLGILGGQLQRESWLDLRTLKIRSLRAAVAGGTVFRLVISAR